jgi:hypothetical protein
MADKPHYSTLLMKDEILSDELSDNDMTYLLKSGGNAKRDRRLTLGELISFIRRLILMSDGISPAFGRGIILENPFTWMNTNINVNQTMKILPWQPFEVKNEFVTSGNTKIAQTANINFYQFILHNKWLSDLFTEISISGSNLCLMNNWADWVDSYGTKALLRYDYVKKL